jgi:glycine dehydrogenase subunit 1
MENFLAHNDKTRQEMLKSISLDNVENLYASIPEAAKMKDFNLSEALSEMQTQRKVKDLANKNNVDYSTFLGAGVYNHFIPAMVGQIAGRYEFLTAYTPYQPEIAQGTLQVMYEYQSMICNITGMDISNASVYDGGSACAEAIFMASRITKKRKALVSSLLNPQYKEVVKTYTHANEIAVEWIDEADYKTDYNKIKEMVQTGEYACVLIQTPNYYGSIEDIDFSEELKACKTLLVICSDISSMSVLTPPSEYGADIVVGDIQGLGIPMNFGGPHAGYMACLEKYMRQLPGRITGRTVDADGNQAFTLTLQTREQHIRREKATSNICSNEALVALSATLYLSVVGEKGFRQAGFMSTKNAHKLSEMLAKKGIKTLNKDFYNEFVIEVENSDEFLSELKQRNILGGLKLDDNRILVATTEMNSEEDLKNYCL